MKLSLIAVGTKMPDWVQTGFNEYARRFGRDMPLELIEVAAGKRGKNADIKRILELEGEKMLSAVSKGSRIITLEVTGDNWSSPQLAQRLELWQQDGRDVALLVGGPEGLAPAVIAASEAKWSLSALTLPHPMVRVVLAEALYRAWSISTNHPYHRE